MRQLPTAILAGLFLTLLLGGCTRARLHVTLHADGSADVACTLEAPRMALAMADGAGLKASEGMAARKAQLAADGFTVEDTSTEARVGFRASQHAADLGALGRILGSKGLAGDAGEGQGQFGALRDAVRVERGWFTTRYILDATIDRSAPAEADPRRQAGSRLGLTFALTLPVTPTRHNAARASDGGRTLEWDIAPGTTTRLQAEVAVPNMPAVAAVAGVVLAGLPVLGVVVVRRRRAVP